LIGPFYSPAFPCRRTDRDFLYNQRSYNVIWATGFRFDYSWLQISGALDAEGKSIHERGVSPVGGLYYVGLPWQTSRNSALIGGVGRDAEAIVRRIAAGRTARA
jgi:hypothetical protein